MASRSEIIHELRKGSITRILNNTQESIARLLDYGRTAGKVYEELHVLDSQYRALIQDKLRGFANLGQRFNHRDDGVYSAGVKLVPMNEALIKDYQSARLPDT